MTVLYHFNSCRHLMNICRNSNHINNAVFFRRNITSKISSAHICHYTDFQISVIFTYYRTYRFFITEFPFTKFIYIKNILRCLVTELHVIYTRFYICFVKLLYKLIIKEEIIYKSSISDCCVNNLYIRSE